MRRKNSLRPYIVSGLIIVFLVTFNYLARGFIQNIFFSIIQKPGIIGTETSLKLLTDINGIAHIGQLVRDNQALHLRLQQAQDQDAVITELQRENKILRQQLHIAPRLPAPLLMAHIVTIQRNQLGSRITIDKGARDHIRTSMPVIRNGNVLIGTVENVFEHNSTVLLLDDPKSMVTVRVGPKEILGNLKGVPGIRFGEATIDFVTSKDEVGQNNNVTTAGFENMSAGLLVGTVSNVSLIGGNLFKSVNVQLAFSPITDSTVFIILTP